MDSRQETGTAHPTIDIRRAEDRFHTQIDWLNSRHSFSFSNHYDPANTHHGLLLVSNDDIVAPDSGFRTHPHQDMEIVTWVLDGELEHKDSEGNKGLLFPGLAQRMSAGTGIWHSEMNPLGDKPVHFVQMWVPPETERINPGYEQLDINGELNKGGLIPIASGRGHQAAISIRQKGASLWGGRLKAGETLQVPDARYVHVFIAKGSAELEGAGELRTGDAVRLTAAGARRLTAGMGRRSGGLDVGKRRGRFLLNNEDHNATGRERAEEAVTADGPRRGMQRLVLGGSVAESVVRRAGCPVLVVKQRGKY